MPSNSDCQFEFEYQQSVCLGRQSILDSEDELETTQPQRSPELRCDWVKKSPLQLALVYRTRGCYGVALKVLQSFAEEANAQELASIFMLMGLIQDDMGEFKAALERFEIARAYVTKAHDQSALVQLLDLEGTTLANLGNYYEALEKYQAALKEGLRIKNLEAVTQIHMNIATVWLELGMYVRSEAALNKAKALATEYGSPGFQAPIAANEAKIAIRKGEHERARELLLQAYSGFQRESDIGGTIRTLINLGYVEKLLGDKKQAEQRYREALGLAKQVADVFSESVALNNLGFLEIENTNYSEAIEYFSKALVAYSVAESAETEWRIWNGIRTVQERKGNLQSAIFAGRVSIQAIERIRGLLSRFRDPEVLRGFMQDKLEAYRELARLLLLAGNVVEAQIVLGLLKESEYAAYVGDERGGPTSDREVHFDSAEQAWKKRYNEIKDDLVAIEKEYRELTQEFRETEDWKVATRLKRLRNDLGVARRAFTAFLRGMEEYFFSKGRVAAKEYGRKNLDELENLQSDLKGLQQETVLLHFLATEHKLYIIVTTKHTGPFQRHSEVARKTLTNAVYQFRSLIKKCKKDCPAAVEREVLNSAEQLYDWLIRPIEKDLEHLQVKMLLLYLDDALRYLPISAVHDGESWLVENYATAVYTAAARGSISEKSYRVWRVAGMGLTLGRDGFSPLPAVKEELNGIVIEGAGDDGVLEGEVYLDDEFTENAVFNALDNPDNTVLHLASHFWFSPSKLDDSFLLLGRGRLTLRDFYEKPFQFSTVDILTLSACNTAMGKNSSGQEVEGLGTMMLKRGARSVLATLWAVSDRATAEFMREFYRQRGGDDNRLGKAAALQKVKKGYIRRANDLEYPAYYSRPYYWAPFVLMGNTL